MIMQQITEDEFKKSIKDQDKFESQKGYSALPEKDGKKMNKEHDEILDKIDTLIEKKEAILDSNTLKKKLDEGITLEDNYIKNAREIFKRHIESRKLLKQKDEDEREYSDEDEKELQISKQIEEESRKKRKSMDIYGNTICNILMQMYQGTLIDGKMSVRKDGIYPYRCQGEMGQDTVLAELISQKAIVLGMFLDKPEKLKTMNDIYNSIDKLNFKINKEYWRLEVDAVKEQIIYFDKPFLLVDNFTGRHECEAKPMYLTGIKIAADGTVDWLGLEMDKLKNLFESYVDKSKIEHEDTIDTTAINIDEIPMKFIIEDGTTEDNYGRKNIATLSISYEMRQYLNKRFDTSLTYLLNSFLNKIKTMNELLETSTLYLKRKGSKWLILGELSKPQEEEMKY
jgi:hypothetical protein